jgi:glyoxylase-like metal-dependent hydrolase (beta-lactamase superfamily II)
MDTGSYHFNIGKMECAVVQDGSFVYHQPAPFFFANAPAEPLHQALQGHGLEPEHWDELVSPYTGLLVNAGGQRVLIDTGAGGMAPTTGSLLENLQAEGIALGDIDFVVLSHAHPDHLGGFTDVAGRPSFPNARYVLMRQEWDYWTSSPTLAHLGLSPEIKHLLIRFAGEKLAPIRERILLVDRETEIAPGVQIIPAPGHTPGHLAVALTSGAEQLLYLGDTALHPVHLEHPDWCAAVDIVPDAVPDTRRRLFDRAAADRALVHSFHFPFPCLGTITPNGTAWHWQPL